MLFINILMLIIMFFSSVGVTYAVDNYTLTILDTQPTINNPIYSNDVISSISYHLKNQDFQEKKVINNKDYYLFCEFDYYPSINNVFSQLTESSMLANNQNQDLFSTISIGSKTANCFYFFDNFGYVSGVGYFYHIKVYLDYSTLIDYKFNYINVQNSSIVTTDNLNIVFNDFDVSKRLYYNDVMDYKDKYIDGVSNYFINNPSLFRFVKRSIYNFNLIYPKIVIDYNGQNYFSTQFFTTATSNIQFDNYNIVVNDDFANAYFNFSDLTSVYNTFSLSTKPIYYRMYKIVNNLNNVYLTDFAVNSVNFSVAQQSGFLDISSYNINFSYGFQSDFIGFNIDDGGGSYGNLSPDKFYRKSSGAFDIFTAVYNLFVYLIFEAPIFKDIFSFIALIIGFLKDCLNLLIDFIGSFGYFGIIFVGLLGFEIILKLLL